MQGDAIRIAVVKRLAPGHDVINVKRLAQQLTTRMTAPLVPGCESQPPVGKHGRARRRVRAQQGEQACVLPLQRLHVRLYHGLAAQQLLDACEAIYNLLHSYSCDGKKGFTSREGRPGPW